MSKSIIVENLLAWIKALFDAARTFVDVRVLLLMGVTTAIVVWVLPDTVMPLFQTILQLCVAFVFAAGLAHLIRKILLNGEFDLMSFAKQAQGNPMASAIVFVGVLGFVAMLINSITSAILK